MASVVILNERTRFGRETGAGIMRNRCSFTSRDMANDWPEAFTYAIVLGWHDEDDPECDASAEIAEKFGWDAPLVEFLRECHAKFRELPDKEPNPDAAEPES